MNEQSLIVLKNILVLLRNGRFDAPGGAIHEAIDFVDQMIADAAKQLKSVSVEKSDEK